MNEATLYDCRKRLQSLAAAEGTYSIRCARTGKRPHPVAGKRFDSRETATKALRVAQQYRQLLREYDPQARFHDLIVCEDLRPGEQTAVGTPATGPVSQDPKYGTEQPSDHTEEGSR